MGKGKDSYVIVSGFVFDILSLDAAEQNLGQAEQHCTLCVNMISCLYSTVQLILPYTSHKFQNYGQKAYPVDGGSYGVFVDICGAHTLLGPFSFL
jgi:hypothetical protein